jgi:para-nitrobenzyl esterase
LRRRRRRARLSSPGIAEHPAREPGRSHLRPTRRRRLPAGPAADALRQRQVCARPYILGSNTDEGTILFITTPPVTTEAAYVAELQARYGSRAAEVAALYPAASFPTPQDALERVVGDSGLVCGTYDTARRAAAGGTRTFLYNFARELPIPILQALDLRAFHGVEMAYVFGIITPPTAEDATLGTVVRGYWTKFARSGNPNHRGVVRWPRYKDKTDRRFDIDVEPSVVTSFRRSECEFWWSVYDAEFVGSPDGAFVD